MKARTGFVSNSSTSSFILVGFEATAAQIKEFKKKLEDEALEERWKDENGVSKIEDTDLLGFRLHISEYDTGEIDLEEVNKQAEKLKEIYGKDIKVKIYSGTESC